jgi:NADH-ubiquinone oxidoreductase chain 5
LLFAGWEGVGLSSYLLVSFWFTRIQANLAAMKAFLMNRFGDWALTLCVLIAWSTLGDLSLPVLFSLGLFLNDSLILLLVILILIGAIAKSAQIGLHTWLPAAMEGPTPVSALIHAATMVTAGVYLLLRFSPILEFTETGLLIVVWFGALTALYGACSGLVEYDLKKVIAYSTTSQLGYMVVAAGLSQYSVCLFHLINHAFFKALLFLSAGAIIHAVADEQDFRRMGGLVLLLPRTYAMILIGSLSLMALPFFTGFYSKDLILEVALATGSLTSQIAYFMTLLGALFTSFYSIRLIILTFLYPPMMARTVVNHIEDPEPVMWIPLFILSLASVFFASIAYDLILGFGSTVYSNSLFVHPNHLVLVDAEFLPSWVKFIPMIPLAFMIFLSPVKKYNMMILSLVIVDWTSLFYGMTDIVALASTLYLAYSVPFVLVSLVLLIVLIGVLILLT